MTSISTLPFHGGRHHLAATAVMHDSVTKVLREAKSSNVLDGKFVRHTAPEPEVAVYNIFNFRIRNSVT